MRGLHVHGLKQIFHAVLRVSKIKVPVDQNYGCGGGGWLKVNRSSYN